jgi:hypothetical protein
VFICVGPINITKGLNTFEVGEIEFTCGQSLTLTDNYLAYSAANSTTASLCETYSKATSCKDISPKCGVSASINIRAPLTVTPTTATKPCTGATSGGSITITPSGGLAPYTMVVSKEPAGGDCPASAPTSSDVNYVTKFTGVSTAQTTAATLGAGNYCIYITDAAGCTYKTTYTLDSKTCCVAPAKPTICQVRPSACGTETKVLLRVSNLTANSDYHVKQGGVEIAGSPQASSAAVGGVLTFTLTPGGGLLLVYGTQTVDGTTCTGTEATCTDLSDCSEPSTSRMATKAEFNAVEQSLTRVTAAPNPFNSYIRFSVQPGVSGRGTLELYNTLGQRVKTIFEGQVQKGQLQTFEYSVPGSQRSNLIYMFRVGNERVSGKLIGLK